MKILAVDDDPDFRALLKPALARQGYTNVTLAESGEDALRIIRDSTVGFDCFILDIQMPDMDGIELCRRIRGLDNYRDAVCVMNTSLSDRKYIDSAFAAGATDYLTKPIDEIELRARLGMTERLVNERRRTKIAINASRHDVIVPTSMGFNDSIPMKRIEGAIDAFAMENYLKTLGIFRAFSISAFAVKIVNARQIYDMDGGAVFSEVMLDVGTCLSDCMKSHGRMISYFGGGQFVCLIDGQRMWSRDGFAATLSEYIVEFEAIYDDLGITMPMIKVGSAVAYRAAYTKSRARIFQDALNAVQPLDLGSRAVM
jgi:DNA-binding response OmpR family regulator